MSQAKQSLWFYPADKGAQVQSASLHKIKDTLQRQPQNVSIAQLSSLQQACLNLRVFICKIGVIKLISYSYVRI